MPGQAAFNACDVFGLSTFVADAGCFAGCCGCVAAGWTLPAHTHHTRSRTQVHAHAKPLSINQMTLYLSQCDSRTVIGIGHALVLFPLWFTWLDDMDVL
jgi:hypothetical protein